MHETEILFFTKLKYLIETKQLCRSETYLYAKPLSQTLLRALKKADISLEHVGPIITGGSRLNRTSVKKRVIAKFLVHTFFRLLGSLKRKSRYSETVLRSWVEVTAELFPREMLSSVVLVYPFGISLSRQLRYIDRLRRQKTNFYLAGYPYSIRLLIKWLISGRDTDLALFEYNAAQKHASWVINSFNPGTVYTTDEFESASFSMHSKLIGNGVIVENRAHGVGKYCPFICYSRFFVLNYAQCEYYRTFSPKIDYQCADALPPTELHPKVETIVLIDQFVKNEGTMLENSLAELTSRLKEIARSKELAFLIKAHPNRVRLNQLNSDIYFYGDVSELKSPIFFTFYSTCYLTFRIYGPVYLVATPVIDPSLVFGPSSDIVNIDELENCFHDA
jgi:hypothetical protein